MTPQLLYPVFSISTTTTGGITPYEGCSTYLSLLLCSWSKQPGSGQPMHVQPIACWTLRRGTISQLLSQCQCSSRSHASALVSTLLDIFLKPQIRQTRLDQPGTDHCHLQDEHRHASGKSSPSISHLLGLLMAAAYGCRSTRAPLDPPSQCTSCAVLANRAIDRRRGTMSFFHCSAT